MKKTVAFLKTNCLHDFSPDVTSLKQQLPKMTVQQQIVTGEQLTDIVSRLQKVEPSVAKLNQEEVTRLRKAFAPNLADGTAVMTEVIWRADVLEKMTALTDAELASLKPEARALLPSDESMGTGFFALVPDARVPHSHEDEKDAGFTYLVTNKHVIQPGVEKGKQCRVVSRFITLNRKPDSTHPSTYAETAEIDDLHLRWTFSDDDSVDLAVAPIGVPNAIYDYFVISTDLFVSDKEITNKTVVEGDPVMFSGLFIQSYSETHRLEPIVRSGILAMIPEGLVQTTINRKLGHIYLAEAHAFGGNSGSPMFIDVARFQSMIGQSYQLLGVISGEVLENADLSLNVTTSISGTLGANSDISTVVPATELLKILESQKLKTDRDAEISKLSSDNKGQSAPH